MPRDTRVDLQQLLTFIGSYNLSHLIEDKDFILSIKQQHKKYYSYLIYIAEIQQYIDDSNSGVIFRNDQYPFLKESCSDIGIAFFSSFHGNYKSSKLLLRSSIETFIKGFCIDEVIDIDSETSIYRMFDNVKRSIFFVKNQLRIKILQSIHQSYKKLCMDVHTATSQNMANISALSYFPSFKKEEATIVCKYVLSLIPSYLTLLLIKYNNQYHRFHHRNKEIIMESIPRQYRPIINNIG